MEEKALCVGLPVSVKQYKVGGQQGGGGNEVDAEAVEGGEGGHQGQKDDTVHARADAQQVVAIVALDDDVGHECRGEQSASQLETAQIGKHPNDGCDQGYKRKGDEALRDVVAKSFLAHEEAEISSEKKLHRPNVAHTFGR